MELFSTLCGSLDGRGVCERMDIWLSPSTVDLKLSQYCLLISYVLCLVAQSCPALCDPMECSPPGSSVHGDSPARIMEWVAMPFCRGSSKDRRSWKDLPGIEPRFPTLQADSLLSEPPGKDHAGKTVKLPDPGTKLESPALQADSLAAELPGKPHNILLRSNCNY